jgi:hypothetical protein
MEKNDLKECHGWSRRWKKMILMSAMDGVGDGKK